MNKKVKIALYALLGILVAMQFFRIDKKVPSFSSNDDFLVLTSAPDDVAQLMRTACYDCHSYETKYPWYANIAPVSWWLKSHIDEGREHLNYSLYATYSADDREEIIEETGEAVTEGWMPLDSYKWGHPEARLTDAQRSRIGEWLMSLSLSGIGAEDDVYDLGEEED
ncbi:MAG: heme-binding domain-containing protein [Saprospiraceae bacterium]|nr:heme-binding domain-containing protein [Saprospiraceae bacterium]